ncbi:MAG: flagellar basal-body rod protein FlgF [Terriglobales bacterium]
MDSGFYAACAGLRAQSQALEVSAHNLANLNTAGFRSQQTTFQSLVAASGPTVPNLLNLATNNFGVLEGSHLDLTSGNLETTGNPLDLGIEGSGFFVVLTKGGMRYTRNGSFQLSSSGQLVTSAGDPVIGDLALKQKGVINLPPGRVSIAGDGTISVNDAVAGSIQLVDFAPGTKLSSEGGTLIAAPEGSARPTQQSTIRQSALESSNVNSINSVVNLIGVQRQAEMLQRAMSVFDTTMNQIAASDLAKV